ncbi:thermonuclease family protein [bacterium]|nr:thermonuclease family protein [bacterium]
MKKSVSRTRLISWLLLALVIAIIATLMERQPEQQSNREGPYAVVRVVDGDTIIIEQNGKKERVRFLRVNTPESVHPDKKQNTPMGKVASDFTKKHLNGKSVTLEFEEERRDKYDRLLAYVFVEEENFCLTLVEEGLSPYYTAYGLSKNYDAEFRRAEQEARDANLGIWSTPGSADKYLRLKSKWGQKRSG